MMGLTLSLMVSPSQRLDQPPKMSRLHGSRRHSGHLSGSRQGGAGLLRLHSRHFLRGCLQKP